MLIVLLSCNEPEGCGGLRGVKVLSAKLCAILHKVHALLCCRLHAHVVT